MLNNQTPKDNRIERLAFTTSSKIRGYSFAIENQSYDNFAYVLGTGGSSVVYRVFQVLNEKRKITIPRAIKFFVMREDLVNDDSDTTFLPAQDNFLEEIKNISQISHENLVQVIDAGEHLLSENDGKEKLIPYIITHLINGCTLREIIENKPSAEFAVARLKDRPEIAIDILRQISKGLDYLHSKNFLHCDVAPKNVFIEAAGNNSLRAIVGDVGMSRCLLGDDEKLFIAGTKSYSPTEISQKFGQKISRNEVKNWFPLWDVFAYSKTAVELLNYASSLSSLSWIESAKSKAQAAFENASKYKSTSEIVDLIEYCLPIHRQRAGIPELESNSVGARKRMMPIEGMAITKRIDSIVRHPAMLRLQGVPQLTIVKSAAPGGNHTRYEHSLGVMENMRRMLSSLIDEPTFLGILRKESIETGLVAALLYNATRFPFSNLIHEINKRLPPGMNKPFQKFGREDLLNEIIGEKFKSKSGITLLQELKDKFPGVHPEKMLKIICGTQGAIFQEGDEAVLHALLNSSLDARVVDFVRRDSLHLGLSGGDLFDIDDLLPHLTVSQPSQGEMPIRVTLKSSGVSVAEQIVLMRYWLYQRVYWNQPNRSYNAMIRRVLLDLQFNSNFEKELREVALHVDEREMLSFLSNAAEKYSMTSTSQLINYVKGYEKSLYRNVYDRNIRQCEHDLQRRDLPAIERLTSEMMGYSTMRQYEIELSSFLCKLIDITKQDTEAPLVLLDVPYEPGHIKMGTDIFVTLKNQTTGNPETRCLDQISPVIEGVNSNFKKDLQRLRIFIRPDIRLAANQVDSLYGELIRIVSD